MKNILSILLVSIILMGCSDNVKEEVLDRYDNGQKKLVVKYKGEGSNEVIVSRITYRANGDIIISENPSDKTKMVREYYYNEDADDLFYYTPIELERNYKDGKLDGLFKEWYENGQLKEEGNYKDGERDGLQRHWYENGQLKYEGNFKDGKGDGLEKLWYENGQLRYEGNIKDGELDGLFKEWYENGQLKYEGAWKDGKE